MKVALLGLGIIGEAWARNLAADGIALAVWNRSPKDVPHFVPDLVEAVRDASHIIIVVSDAAAVADIVARIAPVLRPDQLVIQSSTITPEAVRAAAQVVIGKGARLLDAPFTGSKPAAEQRQTVYYIGGEKADLQAARPVLERLSRAILHVGDQIGSGSVLKLAMNLNIAEVAQALCESYAMASSAGISQDTYFEALKLNVSNSGITALKEAKIRNQDYSPQFSVKHMLKDLHQARSVAGKRNLPQLDTVIRVYEEGAKQNFGNDDIISLIRLLLRS